MTEIRIDADDADRELRRIATVLSDLRPFWPRVTRLFIGWQRLQFESEGAFWNEGDRWTPLSQRYAARKRILWGDRLILQASGQVRRAVSQPQRIATPRSLTLIIDDANAAPARAPAGGGGEKRRHGAILQYHQEGDGVPRRPIVGERLPALAALELEREADAYLRDFLGRF